MDFEKLLNPLGECFNPPFEEYLFSSTFFALGQDIVHKGAVMMSLTCSDQTVIYPPELLLKCGPCWTVFSVEP